MYFKIVFFLFEVLLLVFNGLKDWKWIFLVLVDVKEVVEMVWCVCMLV